MRQHSLPHIDRSFPAHAFVVQTCHYAQIHTGECPLNRPEALQLSVQGHSAFVF